MRAITLHAPWGTLIALGVKRFETRSWPCPPTIIGQRVAFHQAARKPSKVWDDDPLRVGEYVVDVVPLAPPTWCLSRPSREEWGTVPLPLGAVVCTGIVTGSYQIGGTHAEPRFIIDDPNLDAGYIGATVPPDQLPYGDYTPGRYAWQLDDVEVLDQPVPAVGKQGWWTWDGA